MADTLFVGLMSGTSADAIDAALVRVDGHAIELLDYLETPMPTRLRERIDRLSHGGDAEIETMGRLDRELGRRFAQAALDLLARADVDRSGVRAIGCHGQTIRHHPPSEARGENGAATPSEARGKNGAAATLSEARGENGAASWRPAPKAPPSEARGDDSSFTLQIGDPATIAEITGIVTVADFRRADIAAGGEGAPLVPAFHAALFADDDKDRAVVNIGGIANVTLLAGGEVTGFDCGPGNTLLDYWVHRQLGQALDAGGGWAAGGNVLDELLGEMLEHPFFALLPPKSSGREAFNPRWLEERLARHPGADPRDVQATLCELTAAAVAMSLQRAARRVEEIHVCGGGAANADLMRRLQRRLKPACLSTTAELGVEPAWVEAAAFAWLAHRRLEGLPGNVPAVTGADGERVLGAVYPARNAG